MIDTSTGEDGQVLRIKNYIRSVNGCEAPTLMGPTCSTPVAQQILAWWAKDATTMYTRMWQDRSTHPVFETIAKTILRYPVTDPCETCIPIVSVKYAEDTLGYAIDPQLIILPHRFLGR